MIASRLARKPPTQNALISVVASTIWYRRWGCERPFRCASRPSQETDYAGGQRDQAEYYDLGIKSQVDEHPSGKRDQTRQRIEPDAIWALQFRRIFSQQCYGEDLAGELDDDSGRDQNLNYSIKREEAADNRNDPDHQKRDVREVMLRVEATEDLEKVSVARGGERDARISEQQRETRSEGGPKDHHRHNRSHIRPVLPFHHHRDDEIRKRPSGFVGHELAPGNYADDRKVDCDVDRRDRDHADDDRPRNRPAWIFDLVADVADVVIAKIIVYAGPRSRAESE